MSAKNETKEMLDRLETRCVELLHERNNLTRDDLEYLAEKTAALRDERLKQCIASLIGWGDEERAEIETFIAIAIEVMRDVRPSRLREATKRVEIRTLSKGRA